MKNFVVNANVPVEQPSITERSVSLVQAVGQAFVSKLGNVATEAINQLDMAVYDVNHKDSHLLHQYQVNRRNARLATIARQYDLA
jgi:hypothetical protein